MNIRNLFLSILDFLRGGASAREKSADVKPGRTELPRERAAQVDAAALARLGDLYRDGKSVGQDYAEAARWYCTAAEQGHAMAQNFLGNFCWLGDDGCRMDFAGAAKWWRRAAEQGVAAAQASLGFAYETGNGVERDDAEAARWYRKADAQGNFGAKDRLAGLSKNVLGAELDGDEAAGPS